ncbi:MAG TPA: flippase [bacterium]|nr:flippase [bacterium]
MSTRVTNIARNTSYFTLALILQKIISLTYFTLYARVLGPADLGKYYTAISLTNIFLIFIDVGLSNVLTKEVAKDNSKANAWIGSTIAIKLPLALLTSLVLIGLVNILNFPELTRQLVYLSIVCMVLDSFTLTFFACSRAFHNLKFESLSSIIFQLIVLVGSIVILHHGGGVRWLMLSLIAASLYNFIYSLLILWRYWRVKPWPVWHWPKIKKVWLLAAPFAGYAIAQRAYTYLDSVMLAKIAGDVAVGIYQVPFKIINALQFLPMAFVASLYPALSLYWHNNRSQLSITFTRAIQYSAIISLPIAIGGWVIADKLVLIFSDGYTEAIWPLRLGLAALPFIFIGYPIGSLLNACDRQKRNTYNMLIVLIVSIVANLFLIPRYGVIGASLTVMLTSILMVVLGIGQIKSILGQSPQLFSGLLRIVVAASLMGLAVWQAKFINNIFILVAWGGFVYLVALFAVKAWCWSDIVGIFKSFFRQSAD